MSLPFRLDLGRFSFAIGLAVVLYLFALNETNPEAVSETSFTVPVEVVNLPTGLVVTQDPAPIKLRIRAPADVFRRLDARSFVAQADASLAREGEQQVPVTVTSTDLDVREVTPAHPRVRVLLEEVQERHLPVQVAVSGQVPVGYQVGEPKIDPAAVTIRGPTSVVRRAQQAIVDVGLERATVSVNGAYAPRVVDAAGAELKLQGIRPASVHVEVPVTQQAQFKEVGIRPKLQGQPSPGYFVEAVAVEPTSVTIVGDASALQGANFVDTAPIDVGGLSNTTVRRVGLIPPPNTILLQSGQTVTATVRMAPLSLSQTVRVIPEIVNLPTGLEVARPPGPVEVVIAGPAPTLAHLAARDVRVTLDAKGLGPGVHQVDARVQNLPQGMNVERMLPRSPSLELRAAPAPTASEPPLAGTSITPVPLRAP